MLNLDEENKTVTICLRGDKIMETMQESEKKFLETGEGEVDSLWRPEYGSFMIEATPGNPYEGRPEDMLNVESNMTKRRKELEKNLGKNEIIITLTHFPFFGVSNFTNPSFPVNGPIAQSLFIPDQVIHPHPRFA